MTNESNVTESTYSDASETTTNGAATPRKRAPKGSINVGVVDHVAVIQASLKALREERTYHAKRIGEIDAVLGTEMRSTPMTGGPQMAQASAKAPKKAKPAVKAAAAAKPKAPKAATTRMPRRSDESIAEQLSTIVTLLTDHPEGLRAEEIRTKLQLQAKEMPRLLKAGTFSKALRSEGQKRATTYFARGV